MFYHVCMQLKLQQAAFCLQDPWLTQVLCFIAASLLHTGHHDDQLGGVIGFNGAGEDQIIAILDTG